MSADEIRKSMFGAFLRTLNHKTAYDYFWLCLKTGAMENGDNVSWELMEALGYDKFTPSNVVKALQFIFDGRKLRIVEEVESS